MNRTSAFASLQGRLVLWCAENPDEVLTTRDVEVKFGSIRSGGVHARLRESLALGLLARYGKGQGHLYSYGAGPELKRLVLAGAKRLQDEAAANGPGA